MTHDQITAKRWYKELRRRKLAAWKRRLKAEMGPRMGDHFYVVHRAAAVRRQLVRQHQQRQAGRAQEPLPKMVPLR